MSLPTSVEVHLELSPERSPPKSPCPSSRRKNNQFLTKIPEYLNDVPRVLGDSPDEAAVLHKDINLPVDEFDTPKSSKKGSVRVQFDTLNLCSPPVALSFIEDSFINNDDAPLKMVTSKIEPFYYRNGKSMSPSELNAFLLRLQMEFASITEFVGTLGPLTFKKVAKLCNLPSSIGWSMFHAVEKFTGDAVVTFSSFEKFYRAMLTDNNDLSSKIMFILTTSIHGRPHKYLRIGDLYPIFAHVISFHPCFSFLNGYIESSKSFASVSEVLTFFTISGRNTISIPQLRASTFCADLMKLDDESINSEDVSMLSYIQFYVIRDAFENGMSMNFTLKWVQLLEYDNNGFNETLIKRFFEQLKSEEITITDFAVFMFAHHEKSHPSSVRFWFRLSDLDNDGYLTFEDLYPLYVDIHTMLICNYDNFLPIFAMDYLLKAADCIKPIDDVLTMRISCGDIVRSGKGEEFFNYFVNVWNAHALEVTDDRSSWENSKSKWRVFCEDKYASLLTIESDVSTSSINSAPAISTECHNDDTNVSTEVVKMMRSFGFFGSSA